LVSIIIPHFNRSQLLKQTIDSVIQQTFKNWEIIIVDDGSDDKAFAEIKEYESEHNIKVLQRVDGVKGPATCRNLGAKMAKGDFLLFLDSDDLLSPFCLQQRTESMKENEELQLGIFKMEEFNCLPGDKGIIFNKVVPEEKWTGSFLQNENPWNVTCPMWKKDFFERIGGFDQDLLFMEDPELHLRAINYPNAVIRTFYNLPADCYYRIDHIDDTKKDFYYNSIFYRILFYKKVIQKNDKKFLRENTSNIKIGIYRLIKTFLYSRKNQFLQLYNDLIKLMKESKMFSFFEIRKLVFLLDCGNTKSWFLKKMKVKGVCYKLLPVK
jgi:glycosyltransferase involved in cell wall biosynthesis